MTLDLVCNCIMEISSGVVTAPYSGNFLQDRPNSPCNFSFFISPKQQCCT